MERTFKTCRLLKLSTRFLPHSSSLQCSATSISVQSEWKVPLTRWAAARSMSTGPKSTTVSGLRRKQLVPGRTRRKDNQQRLRRNSRSRDRESPESKMAFEQEHEAC